MRRVLFGALAAAAVAVSAPAAVADEPVAKCDFQSFQQGTLTGSSYVGVAFGYAVHAETGGVALRCFVTVNDVPAPDGSTEFGVSGPGHATAYGTVSFEAGDVDVVKFCTEVTTEHGTATKCVGGAPL